MPAVAAVLETALAAGAASEEAVAAARPLLRVPSARSEEHAPPASLVAPKAPLAPADPRARHERWQARGAS